MPVRRRRGQLSRHRPTLTRIAPVPVLVTSTAGVVPPSHTATTLTEYVSSARAPNPAPRLRSEDADSASPRRRRPPATGGPARVERTLALHQLCLASHCRRCRTGQRGPCFEAWGGWGSNPRPGNYEFRALTTELPPRVFPANRLVLGGRRPADHEAVRSSSMRPSDEESSSDNRTDLDLPLVAIAPRARSIDRSAVAGDRGRGARKRRERSTPDPFRSPGGGNDPASDLIRRQDETVRQRPSVRRVTIRQRSSSSLPVEIHATENAVVAESSRDLPDVVVSTSVVPETWADPGRWRLGRPRVGLCRRGHDGSGRPRRSARAGPRCRSHRGRGSSRRQ